ncbi:DASH complex subunit Dad3 [Oesophagostomum dentatum]|uniref:DASH complex subunit Dad3 n=1 Tax=Oesophagostomum dentatum TaxID=61180 RepID=A0A0B1SIQ0_OESDE|nr:DASH complex subunit Dad3 [Oesophagostomum dentatum]
MTKRANARLANSVENNEDFPLWVRELISRFDRYSSTIEQTLSRTLDRIADRLSEMEKSQETILDRLRAIETKLSDMGSPPTIQQSSVYSAMVKFKADSDKIDEKLRTIAWVGIDEKADEVNTRRFDREIVKEAVYTSGCEDLKREFDENRIGISRHPSNRPHGPGKRGRIIKNHSLKPNT